MADQNQSPKGQPFQRSTDSNGQRLRSLIRPSLISPWTKLIGVPTIGLPAVIPLKIPLNQQSYAATILIQSTRFNGCVVKCCSTVDFDWLFTHISAVNIGDSQSPECTDEHSRKGQHHLALTYIPYCTILPWQRTVSVGVINPMLGE